MPQSSRTISTFFACRAHSAGAACVANGTIAATRRMRKSFFTRAIVSRRAGELIRGWQRRIHPQMAQTDADEFRRFGRAFSKLTICFDHVSVTPMKEMPISKFKATCLAVLEQVRKTKRPVRITRFGKPVAEVVPPSAEPRQKR